MTYGGVGRFWQPSGGLRRGGALREFTGPFAEAGYAKAVFNFVAEPAPDGRCVLTTRPACWAPTPPRAAASGSTGRSVYPGSALIRVAWLRAIRRRAERARLR